MGLEAELLELMVRYGSIFKQKIENKPFTIVGSGKQSRDFIHVKDVVKLFLQLEKKIRTKYLMLQLQNLKHQPTKIIGGKKVNIQIDQESPLNHTQTYLKL